MDSVFIKFFSPSRVFLYEKSLLSQVLRESCTLYFSLSPFSYSLQSKFWHCFACWLLCYAMEKMKENIVFSQFNTFKSSHLIEFPVICSVAQNSRNLVEVERRIIFRLAIAHQLHLLNALVGTFLCRHPADT